MRGNILIQSPSTHDFLRSLHDNVDGFMDIGLRNRYTVSLRPIHVNSEEIRPKSDGRGNRRDCSVREEQKGMERTHRLTT